MQEGMNKVLISQQKETLQKLVEKPVMLEGKNVRHKCRDPESREVEWFSDSISNISKQNAKEV